MDNQIDTLPYWRSFVSVGEIPGLIASALYPQDQLTISRLRKTSGIADQALTAAEWELVHSLTPPYRDGMSELEFRALETAFLVTGTDWHLVPYCVGGSDAWAMACADHEERLKAAIQCGDLMVYTGEPTIATRGLPAEPSASILVEDFKQYARKLPTPVIIRVDGESVNGHWQIEAFARIRAGQMARDRAESQNVPAGKVRVDIWSAKFYHQILADIQHLSDQRAIKPRTDERGTRAITPCPVDTAWYLTRTDLEIVRQYSRQDEQSKKNYLQELLGNAIWGRYTLKQAADYIAVEGGEDYKRILSRLKAAALKDELPMYLPGENLRLDYDELARRRGSRAHPRAALVVTDFYEEARWDELNAWLEEYEPHIACRFPDPAPQPIQDATKRVHAAANGPESDKQAKLIRSLVTPLIERAIIAGGSTEFPKVLVALRELALHGEKPFTGEITGKGFVYTDGNNQVRTFTKNALGSYLRRRRKRP
jgi:hypothetical protein